MKTVDDFLEIIVVTQLLTAVILGQINLSMPKPAEVHAVDVFSMIYNPTPRSGP